MDNHYRCRFFRITAKASRKDFLCELRVLRGDHFVFDLSA